jgi:hypothetical protein
MAGLAAGDRSRRGADRAAIARLQAGAQPVQEEREAFLEAVVVLGAGALLLALAGAMFSRTE